MSSQENTKESLDLREIMFVFKKHLFLVIFTTVVFSIFGFAVSKFYMTPKYKADTTLIINPGQVSQSTAMTYDQVATTQQLVGTYSVILKSDTILDQVIQNLDLNTDAAKLSKSIAVTGVNSTEVIDLSVKSTDPQQAADIANEITKVAPDIIIKTVKAGSLEVISFAKPNSVPVSPNIPLYTAISFAAGLLISSIISFGIEFFDNTISSDEDVKKHLGISVIGVIPFIDKS